MKTVVTHLAPDLDAVAACWLIRKYFPGWDEADIAFVPVESTLDNKPPDDKPDVIHVDTGGGKFDHHGEHAFTSATKLVFEDIKKYDYAKKKDILALERVVEYVTLIDNFREVDLPQADADVYDYCPHQLIFAMRSFIPDDRRLAEVFVDILNSMQAVMKTKISAEEDIKNGFTFSTKWGKTIAMDSKNEEAVKLALKKNYTAAVRKDPQRGYLKIKIHPSVKIDLTDLFDIFKSKDPGAHWSIQGNGHIIINGSSRKPNSIATRLQLHDVIAIMTKIK